MTKYLNKNTWFVIAVLILFSCRDSPSGEKSSETSRDTGGNALVVTRKQFEEADMKLEKITKHLFPEEIQVTGSIDVPPENRAIISAVMGGYIKNAPLLVGDKVTKGQRLLTLEHPDFINLQQQYLEVKEQLGFLEAEYRRQETLTKENISSQKSFLRAESEYRTALAKSNGLRKQLQLLSLNPAEVEAGNISSTIHLYSPIAGSITKTEASVGKYVSPATEIIEVVNNDHVHLELTLFEKDILKIQRGQTIHFQVPEASDDTFSAEVYLIGKAIGPERTIKVHGHISEDENEEFMVGMFVEATIGTANGNGEKEAALPSAAVEEVDGNFYVLKLRDQTGEGYLFEMIPVSEGKVDKGYTSVKQSNIDSTATFLVRGAYSLMRNE